MGSVIRATEAKRVPQHAAFNFEDMATRANGYLEKVRAEAAEIVVRAKKEAEGVKRRAQQEGFQAGKQQHEQVVRDQLSTVLPALAKATKEIQHAKQAWLREWESSAVRVAALIAEKIIRRELTDTPAFAERQVREALELATACSRLKIRLNPSDHQQIADHVEVVTQQLHPVATAEVLADETVAPGGCRVETNFGVIDMDIESQLKRVVEELT